MKALFANSVPKAGTNLLMSVLTAMGFKHRGTIHAGLVHFTGIRSLARVARWLPLGSSVLAGIDMPVAVSRREFCHALDRLTPGDVLAGHMGYVADPVAMLVERSIAPIMFVRDPRAIVASFVPYVLSRKDHPLHRLMRDLDRVRQYQIAAEGWFGKNFSLQPIDVRCSAVLPWVRSKDVLTLRFEDMVGEQGGGSETNRKSALTQLAQFVGVSQSSSDEPAGGALEKRHTFRKGRIDSWREEIPPEVMDQLNEVTAPFRTEWGYDP